MVSSGLVNTTTAATLGRKFEEEVGTPARLQAADISAQRKTEARLGKAGFIERREDVGPDFRTIAELAKSIGAGQQAGATTAQAQPTTTFMARKQPGRIFGAGTKFARLMR